MEQTDWSNVQTKRTNANRKGRMGSMNIRGLSGYSVEEDTFAVHDGYEKVVIDPK